MLLLPVVDAGLKVAVTPLGSPRRAEAPRCGEARARDADRAGPAGSPVDRRLAGLAARVKFAAFGVAVTWLEFALSPSPLTALTT